MNHLARRIVQLEEYARRQVPSLFVQYVAYDGSLPAHHHPRLTAIADQVNAHVDALVAEHGPGIVRPHRCRNDALEILSDDDLDWMCDLIEDGHEAN